MVSSKSKLIIGQKVVRREVFQQKLFNVTLQTLELPMIGIRKLANKS